MAQIARILKMVNCDLGHALFIDKARIYDFSSTVGRKYVFSGSAVAGKYVLSGRCQEKNFLVLHVFFDFFDKIISIAYYTTRP